MDYKSLIEKYHKEHKEIRDAIDETGFPPIKSPPRLIRSIGIHKWYGAMELYKNINTEFERVIQTGFGATHILYRSVEGYFWSVTKTHDLKNPDEFYVHITPFPLPLKRFNKANCYIESPFKLLHKIYCPEPI